jgi:hypothetical protein
VADEDRIRELIRDELEALIKERGWPDDEATAALLEVAKNHVWAQGAYARIKYWANLIAMLGIIGTALVWIAGALGFELVKR